MVAEGPGYLNRKVLFYWGLVDLSNPYVFFYSKPVKKWFDS